MAGEITIPLLPCHSINEVLEFYRAIGFDVAYQQSRPNNYAVVQRGGIELHFFTMREYVPANSYSSCYVRVPDVDALYGSVVIGLRAKYGRLPSAGIPRVIPLKSKSYGVREFIVVDPGGNWIRIGQIMNESANASEGDAHRLAGSKLAKAVHTSGILSDSQGDLEAAAKFLDEALSEIGSAINTDRVKALVARAGLAITMENPESAAKLLEDLRNTRLTRTERHSLADELQTAADLDHQLAHSSFGKEAS